MKEKLGEKVGNDKMRKSPRKTNRNTSRMGSNASASVTATGMTTTMGSGSPDKMGGDTTGTWWNHLKPGFPERQPTHLNNA